MLLLWWLQEVLGVFSSELGSYLSGHGLPTGACTSLSSFEEFLTLLVTINAGKEAEAQSQSAPAQAGQNGCAHPGKVKVLS